MRVKTLALAAVLVALASPPPARAQDDVTRGELWPEVDAFVGLGERSRLFFLATVSRNAEENLQEAMVGGHVDFFLKPRLRKTLARSPDAIKRHYLAFRAGYRYSWDMHDGTGFQEHRGIFEITGRAPLGGGFLLVNRNRLDLRDVNGEGSWRYRNRMRLERDIALGSRAATPYAMVEFGYDSRYDAWNRQRYFAGIEWPIGKTPVLDTYYCRQNDSRSSIAHVNAFGLAFNLFF